MWDSVAVLVWCLLAERRVRKKCSFVSLPTCVRDPLTHPSTHTHTHTPHPPTHPLQNTSVPAGERFSAAPLSHQQLTALNRLAGAKKATDRRTWLEGIVGPLALATHASASGNSGNSGSGSGSSSVPQLTAAIGGLGLDSTSAAAAGSGGSAEGQQQQQAKGGGAGPVLPVGLDVSPALGVVRGRVLPPPHLAYAAPECAYPGSQVSLVGL